MKTKFTTQLLKWHKNNPRELVWKADNDAYSTWLSEIIMQQTRVVYGSQYYIKFKKLFPTVFDLAHASQQEVVKAWEGLGYYSRARNLHYTAKHIVKEFNGIFPTSSNELQKLKGIGVYTASAIASFVSNEIIAAIDGNAYRVLSRYYGIKTPIDSTIGKKEFQALGNHIIDDRQPGTFNQALMNFGALICTPKQPYCIDCVLNDSCIAYNTRSIDDYPVKKNKLKVRNRFFTYFIIYQNQETYIVERTSQDVWQNLWEFPMIELEHFNEQAALEKFLSAYDSDTFKVTKIHKPKKQRLSHQLITIQFIELETTHTIELKQYKKVSIDKLLQYPFPKTIKDFLKNNVTSNET